MLALGFPICLAIKLGQIVSYVTGNQTKKMLKYPLKFHYSAIGLSIVGDQLIY